MATSVEVRRGASSKAQGIDSDIILGPTITAVNLAAELTKYPDALTGSVAYNRAWFFDPTDADAILVFLDADGKWYDSTGTEVT